MRERTVNMAPVEARAASMQRPAARQRAGALPGTLPLAVAALPALGLGIWLALMLAGPSLGAPGLLLPRTQSQLLARALASVDSYDSATARKDGEAARAALEAARTDLRDLLAASPAHPTRWAYLAEIEERLGAPIDEVERLLATSYSTGRLEFPAVTHRVLLALRIWSRLDASARDIADRDLRTLLALKPNHRSLVLLAQSLPELPPARLLIVKDAIARHQPDAMELFEFYRKFPPKERLWP